MHGEFNLGDLSLENFQNLSFEDQNKLTGAKALIRARPFNPHLIADTKQLNDFLDTLATEIEKQEARKRRSGHAATAFRAALRALVLDLFSAQKADKELQIAINLNSNSYSRHSRYQNQEFADRQFRAALDGLRSFGYLEIVKRG